MMAANEVLTSAGAVAVVVGAFSVITLVVTRVFSLVDRRADWKRQDDVSDRVEAVAAQAKVAAELVKTVAERAEATHGMVVQIDRAVNGKPDGQPTMVQQVQDMTDSAAAKTAAAAAAGAAVGATQNGGVLASLKRIEDQLARLERYSG